MKRTLPILIALLLGVGPSLVGSPAIAHPDRAQPADFAEADCEVLGLGPGAPCGFDGVVGAGPYTIEFITDSDRGLDSQIVAFDECKDVTCSLTDIGSPGPAEFAVGFNLIGTAPTIFRVFPG